MKTQMLLIQRQCLSSFHITTASYYMAGLRRRDILSVQKDCLHEGISNYFLLWLRFDEITRFTCLEQKK